MPPFDPWSWRDPAALAGGYDQAGPDRGPAAGPSDAPGFSAAEADRGEIDLAGYRVEATDGRVGTVSEAGAETGARWLVVDTGPWILGRTVLLPVGAVERVDHLDRVVHVDRTREHIKGSPEYDPATFGDPAYRARVGAYWS